MFNSVGVISKPNDFTSQKTALELGVLLKDLGAHFLQDKDEITNEADLIIVVGGDGTILSTARTYVNTNIPILGINLGRLGFLADVSVDSMGSVVAEILNGEFIKEKRSLLHCQIEKNGKIVSEHLAFNEVVIHRNETPRMIEFELHVDDDFVNNQRADGIIVTSPTGSTAYALSSGGPIMHPSTNAICLVSISPHTMSHRPFILHGESEVFISLLDCDERATISFDAQSSVSAAEGVSLRVKRHVNFVHLIHPKGYDYFEIIRSKLHWGQKV
jgi:NAD+ kinase